MSNELERISCYSSNFNTINVVFDEVSMKLLKISTDILFAGVDVNLSESSHSVRPPEPSSTWKEIEDILLS